MSEHSRAEDRAQAFSFGKTVGEIMRRAEERLFLDQVVRPALGGWIFGPATGLELRRRGVQVDWTTALCEGRVPPDRGLEAAIRLRDLALAAVLDDVAREWGVFELIGPGCDDDGY